MPVTDNFINASSRKSNHRVLSSDSRSLDTPMYLPGQNCAPPWGYTIRWSITFGINPPHVALMMFSSPAHIYYTTTKKNTSIERCYTESMNWSASISFWGQHCVRKYVFSVVARLYAAWLKTSVSDLKTSGDHCQQNRLTDCLEKIGAVCKQ
jgi:hypothetical protein